ncbi:MAG: hypothetical protein ABS63_10780 [Microbacterium sp. SCN 70-27]|nr:MAG: hypothetical protein ABS63_10780 [Microbacterium sp. SCN 70-27]
MPAPPRAEAAPTRAGSIPELQERWVLMLRRGRQESHQSRSVLRFGGDPCGPGPQCPAPRSSAESPRTEASPTRAGSIPKLQERWVLMLRGGRQESHQSHSILRFGGDLRHAGPHRRDAGGAADTTRQRGADLPKRPIRRYRRGMSSASLTASAVLRVRRLGDRRL